MLRFIFLLALLVGFERIAWARVYPAEIFGDHMVFQCDKPICVWGRASGREKIHVSLAKSTADTQADPQGNWLVALPAQSARAGLVLSIRGEDVRTFTDISVGEVWVVIGQQSGMWDGNVAAGNSREAAPANLPGVDILIDRTWLPCTAAQMKKIPVAPYFFARDIQRELRVPVGIVFRPGGDTVQTWTPKDAYERFPELRRAYIEATRLQLKRVRDWADKTEREMGTVVPAVLNPPQSKELIETSGSFDSQMKPLLKYPVRGVLWNIGDGNRNDGMFLADRIKALVECWRQVSGEPSLPFYWAQSWRCDRDEICTVWQAELAGVANVAGTEIVHTGDLQIPGQPQDDRRIAGERFARIALAKEYGKSLVCAGPRYKTHAIEGSAIRVAFDHVGSGLASRDGKPLTRFEIAGADGKYFPAKARIDGATVLVSSDKVTEPKNVSYGWHSNAVCNLSNKDGLPAYPFRTAP